MVKYRAESVFDFTLLELYIRVPGKFVPGGIELSCLSTIIVFTK